MPKDPDPKPRIIDFELLPEAQNPDMENHKQAVPRLIALLMDDLFRLPGTRFRFGLNPIGVGEIFAFWFRPSHRNYQLLRTHIPAVASGPIISRRKDWLFVIAIVTAFLLLFSFCAGVGVYLVLQPSKLLHTIRGVGLVLREGNGA